MAVIEAEGLTKRFGAITAVDELSFSVEAGSVVGFVGPNGAGKSTTIRMLLGLVRPTAGTATVLGKPISDAASYLRHVGALIEEPAFYPKLTGEQNLLVHCRLRGIDAAQVRPVLSTVGLSDAGARKFAAYSQGMRQRLAIAAALLPNPQLLVLDEPANALDPQGIRDVRQLLRALADQGRTVFVSSHLLSEVEQACDEVIVIRKGRVVHHGAVGDLLAGGAAELVVATEKRTQHRTVRKLCGEAGYAVEERAGRLHIAAPVSWAGELNRRAMEAGVTLIELRHERADLEQAFFELTRDDLDLRAPAVAAVDGRESAEERVG